MIIYKDKYFPKFIQLSVFTCAATLLTPWIRDASIDLTSQIASPLSLDLVVQSATSTVNEQLGTNNAALDPNNSLDTFLRSVGRELGLGVDLELVLEEVQKIQNRRKAFNRKQWLFRRRQQRQRFKVDRRPVHHAAREESKEQLEDLGVDAAPGDLEYFQEESPIIEYYKGDEDLKNAMYNCQLTSRDVHNMLSFLSLLFFFVFFL